VLTIKGRPEFTKRWMAYMNSVKCKFKILIADGGDDVALQNHLASKGDYPNLNYDYFKYPYDTSLKDYYKKLCDITDQVKTPYVLYADNDDFIILDSIEEYIIFLDLNADYVTCGGFSSALSIYSKKNELLNTCAGNYFNIRFDKSIPFSIKSKLGVDRVCDFFKYVESERLWFIWYDVQRTSVVKITHEYIKKYEFKDAVSFEIYKISSLLLLGKAKRLDSIFYIRQNGSSELSKSLDLEANVLERFIKVNAFKEIVNGMLFLDKAIAGNEALLIRAFSFWVAEKVRILYFSSESKARFLLGNIPYISNNYAVNNFLIRHLYLLRNLISSRKVYFLRIKSIESIISTKNVM
jgi:glycosyltransferase domain-containing protein